MKSFLDFEIHAQGKLSVLFLELGYYDFASASTFIKNLPYKRNVNKQDNFCVFNDGGGTCSTKHALLKRLADENNQTEIKLMLGVFKMNAENTPKISAILEKYKLIEMPEAHNYLKIKNQIFDYTRRNSQPENFINDLMEEIEITPQQISNFKVEFHQNKIKKYLKEHSEIPYSAAEFWGIREECILALQQ